MIGQYLFFLPLGYIALFLVYTAIITAMPKSKKIIFCTLCASYFTLLIIGIFLQFSIIILALLLGMTITGIAYKTNEYLVSKGYEGGMQHFALQLGMTIFGLVALYLLMKGGYT